MDEYAIKEALESTETKATVLHAILRNKYGEGAYEWDLATIAMEVADDYKAEISSESANRWAAMQLVMTNNAFFQRLDAFLAVCNAVASGEPFFGVFDPVTTEEAAWTIAEVSLNREMLPFSYAIKHYLKTLLAADGYGDDYPAIFDAVLADEQTDAEQTVREQVGTAFRSPNEDVVEQLIDDELADMVVQFNRIPSLAGIDNLLLASTDKTLVEAL
jgi:hypothetical protein